MVEQKQKERKFLEQLLDGTKVENYTIPVPIKAELRKYQQVRKHFSRENERARGRHACLLLVHPFFLVPTTSKRLLRRLAFLQYPNVHRIKNKNFPMDRKSKDNHRSWELQSWTKVLGHFCIYGAFFQFIHKKHLPHPTNIDWTRVSRFFVRVSTLCRVGGWETSRKCRKRCTISWGNREITENYECHSTVLRTFVQDFSWGMVFFCVLFRD